VKLSDFQFDLPSKLIAQHPVDRRDASRLMFVERSTGKISHHCFSDLPHLISPSDLLVLNDTQVFPARIFGVRKGGKARIEALLLREIGDGCWEALLKPARRAPSGSVIVFEGGGFEAEVSPSPDPVKRILWFNRQERFWDWLNRHGHIPLPPYIRRSSDEFEPEDRIRYQTVYARRRGSVAAPTAGLHFSRKLLKQVRHCSITLHVGYGTFKPVTVDEVEKHRMDAEFYSISRSSALRIRRQIASGNRVISVGTTTTRTLEHVVKSYGEVTAGSGWTDLFIYPGFRFEVVSGLVTNFHLPGSTLLLLVSAFAGRELIREAYDLAIRKKYRFFSYGDAMLIL